MTSKQGRGGKKPQPERSPQPRSKQSGAFQNEIAEESSEEEVERSEQLQLQQQQLSPSQTSGSLTQTYRDGDVQREALSSADQRARNKRDTPLRSILRSEEATQRATASPATSVRLPSSENFSSDPVMSSPVAQDRALTLLRRMCALLADTLHDERFHTLATAADEFATADAAEAAELPHTARKVTLQDANADIYSAEESASAESSDQEPVLSNRTLVNVLTNSKSFNSSRIPMYKGFADSRSVEEFLRQCNRELIAQEIPNRKWVKSITPLFTNEVMVVIERKYGKSLEAINKLKWDEFSAHLSSCLAPMRQAKNYQTQLDLLKQQPNESAWAYVTRATTLFATLELQVTPAILYFNDQPLRKFIKGFSHTPTRTSIHTWFTIYRSQYGHGEDMFSRLVTFITALLDDGEPLAPKQPNTPAAANAAQTSPHTKAKANGGQNKKKPNGKENQRKQKSFRCFYCQEPGHIKPGCDQYKRDVALQQERHAKLMAAQHEQHVQLLAALQPLATRAGNE